MYTFVLIIHFIVCVLLIMIVLLQVGKSFGLSSLMGGGTSDAIVTTASGNVILKRITLILAVLFMVTSFSLTFITSKRLNTSSIMNIIPPVPTLPDVKDPRLDNKVSSSDADDASKSVNVSTVPAGQN